MEGKLAVRKVFGDWSLVIGDWRRMYTACGSIMGLEAHSHEEQIDSGKSAASPERGLR